MRVTWSCLQGLRMASAGILGDRLCLMHLLLLSLFSSAFHPSLALTWTYKQKPWNKEALPTKSMLPVACYSDGADVDFKSDGFGCSIKETSVGHTELKCDYLGIYAVTCEQVGLKSKRFLRFVNEAHCFSWNVLRVKNKINLVKPWENFTAYQYGSSVEFLHVWIDDSDQLSWSDRLHPTPESAKVNLQFYKKGQIPTLEPILDYPFAVDALASSFNPELGLWTVEVRKTGIEIVKGYRVRSRPVSVNHCTIPDMDILMPGPSIEITNDTHQRTSSVAPGSASFEIFRDKKYPNTFIFVNGGNVSVTTDAFRSHGRFYINASEEYQIESLAFSDYSLAILSTSGKLLFGTLRRNHNYPVFVQVSLHEMNASVLGVNGSPGSSGVKLKQNEDGFDHWVFWTKENVYQCLSGLCSQVHIQVEDLSLIGFLNECFVEAAVCGGLFRGEIAAAFACMNSANERKFVFGRYYSKGNTWNMTAIDLLYEVPVTHSCKITYLKHQNWFIFWSPFDIFYVINGDSAKVKVLEGEILKDLQEILEGDDKLLEVVAYSGKIVMLTSHNVLFYGHATVQYIFKLERWLPRTVQAHIWFDDLGSLHLSTLEPDGIKDNIYPLDMEVQSVLLGINHPPCPYTSFHSDKHTDEIHLDRNEKFSMESRLSALMENEVSVQFSISSPQFLSSVHSSELNQAGRKVFEERAVLSFSSVSSNLNATYENYRDFLKTSAVAMVTYKPTNTSLFCKDPMTLMSTVHGGCPLNKYISVKHDPARCEYFGNFSIMRSAQGIVINESDLKLVEPYQWNKWGCPVLVHIEDNYIPQLVFMDGDREAGPVTENFVVYEIFNQSFEYSATEGQVRCLRPAQNWNRMTEEYLTRNGLPNLTYTAAKDEIWGSWNYRSCFEAELSSNDRADEDQQHLQLPYEVLNRSGLSAINFNKDRNQIYIFRATVVDPNSSFCILQTEFAVRTFGAMTEVRVAVTYTATIGTFLGICLAFLGSLYFVFMEYYSPKYDDEE